MLAPYGLNLHFYIFFTWTMCKKILYISIPRQKNLNDILSIRTPIKHHNNTPFMENLNPKCNKKREKKCQILKLQNENETKNKNLYM